MRREFVWGLGAFAALALGALGAQSYARAAVPFYAAMVRILAVGHPWDLVSLDVVPNDMGPGTILRLVADVRRAAADPAPAARVIARVQVGEAAQTPVVFWALLLLWPAPNWRRRLTRLAVGIPLFLGLEAITTAVQLMHNLPEASAMLAGERDPVTLWERWSCFLEGGGHFVVAVVAAVVTVVVAGRIGASPLPAGAGGAAVSPGRTTVPGI